MSSSVAWAAAPRPVQLTLLRFREFVREPEALFWTLLFPVILTTGLGVAFRNQAPRRRARLPGRDAGASPTRPQRDLASRWHRPDGRRPHARSARASVVLVAEPGANGGVVYRYDDTNPEGRTARMLADRALQRAAGRVDPVPVQDDLAREAGSRYIDFLVPGLVGMGIMSNAVWGLGFSIVDARRRKLMKRIVATPMRADGLPAVVPDLAHVRCWCSRSACRSGSACSHSACRSAARLLELASISVLGLRSRSARWVCSSRRGRRTIEAVSGLMNLVLVPMWILSGVFFSSERFPDAVQPFIKALPLTALIDALRANMLQGAGLVDVAPALAALGGCARGVLRARDEDVPLAVIGHTGLRPGNDRTPAWNRSVAADRHDRRSRPSRTALRPCVRGSRSPE